MKHIIKVCDSIQFKYVPFTYKASRFENSTELSLYHITFCNVIVKELDDNTDYELLS